jgi:hypothetical protein
MTSIITDVKTLTKPEISDPSRVASGGAAPKNVFILLG